MAYIILAVLIGLNVAPFLFQRLNIWAAQGFFAHLGIIALFAYSFFDKPKNVVKNVPLALFFLWVVYSTSVICYRELLMNRYDTHHFFQYFNLLMVILFYRFVAQSTDSWLIQKGREVIKYVILFNLFICVVQYFNVSQFFTLLFTDPKAFKLNNMVVGMMGNGTHLSGFLAMCAPVLFTKQRENVLALCLLVLTMFLMGTTKGEPALNGFVILTACALFYSFFKSKKVFIYLLLSILLLLIISYMALSPKMVGLLLSDNGRIGLWTEWLPVMKRNFVTGIGLGSIGLIAPTTAYKNAFHLHLEYYHFLVELGIVGIILIVNVINDFFHAENDDLTLTYKTIVVGFLVSCFFTYPAHLWLSSMFAVFSYAIVKGNSNGCIDSQATEG